MVKFDALNELTYEMWATEILHCLSGKQPCPRCEEMIVEMLNSGFGTDVNTDGAREERTAK